MAKIGLRVNHYVTHKFQKGRLKVEKNCEALKSGLWGVQYE